MRAALVLFIALLLGAVSEPASAQPPKPPPVVSTQIDVAGSGFSPPKTTVFLGNKVRWTVNRLGETAHTVTTDPNQTETFDSGPISNGLFFTQGPLPSYFEFEFKKVGTIKYHCRVHANMKGQVTIIDKPIATEELTVAVPPRSFGYAPMVFNPAIAILDINQSFRWVNHGYDRHTIAFENKSLKKPPALGAGVDIPYAFNETGEFRYRCTLHSTSFTSGMAGRITVVGKIVNTTTLPTTTTAPAESTPGPEALWLLIGLGGLAWAARRRG